MNTPTIVELRELAQQLPDKIPYLKMLVLFGSRATGKTHANSDWDFAAFYDQEIRNTSIRDNAWGLFEAPLILGEIFGINHDKIDVVELNHCSPLLAHFVARDGKVLYEQEIGEFDKFRHRVLLSDVEIKKIEQAKRQNIEHFLQRWGV
ncbi:type VII toxin-antitoxin system MntA family adenylyltransferase antitoxin [Iningainema tapete]|uniref:Nucleotidyltransferase domain-containing protein n=1 Tax=Iningainema tapete BLCC-T55 TaxID=2748662 RepID=A0A8J7C5Z6_9CYAN|nr:nucleotidyltransferase domain-containing protein [Iningainema tapete]MBD2773684.1 nucleotidyltransferase domain-containing protein [Iningainema tapete BLCC-T55]